MDRLDDLGVDATWLYLCSIAACAGLESDEIPAADVREWVALRALRGDEWQILVTAGLWVVDLGRFRVLVPAG